MFDSSSLGNPFAALTVVVAPAILTNASSVLCMGTANRVARVVDRTRVVVKEMSALTDSTGEQYQFGLSQLDRLRRRAHLLFWALRFTYASLGLFAATALLAVIGSVLAYYVLPLPSEIAALTGLLTGVLAVIALVSGCVVMVREVQLALETIHEEAQHVRDHYFA